MTAGELFLIATYGVLPAWILILLAPGWTWTHRIVHSVLPPLLLGGLYIWLVSIGAFTDVPSEAGFGSLAGVMAMFQSPSAVLAGWVHYLVFDLFVGAWIARDAMRRNIGRIWVAPCLLGTLMLGPAGLLLYLLLRALLGREWWALDEGTA